MAQHYEELRSDSDDSIILFSATADTEMRGTAIFAHGIWFSPEQAREIKQMLTRCNVFLAKVGEF